MTCIDALTTLGVLGPISFVAGLLVGYLYRDHDGRATHDRRS